MKKLINLIVAFIFAQTVCLNAQETGKYYRLDVNGIRIGTKMTTSQVAAYFGTPDSYETQNSEFGVSEYYFYGDGYLMFENQELMEFTITEPQFRLLTSHFNGGISVGSSLSVFDDFESGRLLLRDPAKGIYWLVDDSDSYFEITVENGRMKDFHFHYNP